MHIRAERDYCRLTGIVMNEKEIMNQLDDDIDYIVNMHSSFSYDNLPPDEAEARRQMDKTIEGILLTATICTAYEKLWRK